MNGTYVCAECGVEQEKGWTDEEAKAEAAEKFPGLNPNSDQAAVVCDPCYQKIMAVMN